MSRKKNILTVCTLLFMCTMSWGQIPATGLQRSVAYKTSLCKTFKIPCYAELEALSPLDWVYLETKEATIRFSEFSIVSNWLTITYHYPQMPRYERDYEFQMGKSVTDKWGTRLYYHDGEQYYNLENEVENENFAVNAEMVGSYGVFNGLFDVSIDTICMQLDTAGIPYYRWGQKLLMTKEDTIVDEFGDSVVKRMEIETDFSALYMEIRTFANNEHQMTDRKEYHRVNDFVVPKMSKRVYYSELPSGTRYQITEMETYLSYQVKDENGNAIVNIEEEVENPTDFSIDVVLDALQNTAIVHFTPPITGNVNTKIKDALNVMVLEENTTLVQGNSMQMDISQLEPSTYMVICIHNDKVAQADFIKDGIGTYQEPNPTEMSIQIVPNPVTALMNIIFPVDIQDIMHIKITDMMGIPHYENDVYIAGNMLMLDVDFLPAGGMYYIICTNNEGTATARFFKQ